MDDLKSRKKLSELLIHFQKLNVSEKEKIHLCYDRVIEFRDSFNRNNCTPNLTFNDLTQYIGTLISSSTVNFQDIMNILAARLGYLLVNQPQQLYFQEENSKFIETAPSTSTTYPIINDEDIYELTKYSKYRGMYASRGIGKYRY